MGQHGRRILVMPELNNTLERHSFEQKFVAGFAVSKWQDVRILVAVSAGADSVALLRAIVALREADATGDIHVIHVNHRWRAEASDADQRFVEGLSEELGVPCHVVAAEAGDKTEEGAREQRYRAFLDQARQTGARLVLTAHTKNDQIETLIDRIFRGTGLVGLKGIPRTRSLDHGISLVRPLLEFERDEILQYLAELDQAYCEDATNQSLDYTRNRIRNELLPLLKQSYHADADQAVLRLRELALELSAYVAGDVREVREAAVSVRSDGGFVLHCDRLTNVASVVIRELFVKLWSEADWPRKAMTRVHWLQLESLVSSDIPAVMLPGEIRAEKNGEQLTLTRR
tara:strand:- start:134 stop:1165 length:1032 start_codon:yes stop_codon:yes gene_type:complete